jgi:CPA2 family monovalent cation:H+ antiporter-2
MALWDTILDVVILLAVAMASGMLFMRLRQSVIVGYMAAGVILGPGGFNIIHNDAAISGMAELGVVLLLFTVGLEFPWTRLRKMGGTALGGGGLQLLFTSIAGTIGFLAAGFPSREAFVLGPMIAPSTTALLLRLFTERSEMDSVHARNASVITILQGAFDIPLLILMTAVGVQATVGQVFVGMGRTALFALGLFVGLYIICNFIIPKLLHVVAMSRNREIPILLAIVTCLVAAWASKMLHISSALGSFVAGALLAESPFATQMRADVNPMKTLFATLFFASFGILVDVSWAAEHIHAVILLAVAIIAGKSLIVWPIMRLFGSSHRIAIATGICLSPLDEFIFVLAQIGLTMSIFTPDTFQLIVSAALVTLFLTPLLVASSQGVGRVVETVLVRLHLVRPTEAMSLMGHKSLAGHVILVGFGPAGRGVLAALRMTGRDVVVAELNPQTAASAQEQGILAEVGDASRVEVLEHLNIATASAIVLTIPDHRAVLRIIRQVRALAPEVTIIARARHHWRIDELASAGAYVVVDEEEEVGRVLGAEVINHLPILKPISPVVTTVFPSTPAEPQSTV